MLTFVKNLISILDKLVSWWAGRKKAREANAAREAVATHDRKRMNEILQERRTK